MESKKNSTPGIFTNLSNNYLKTSILPLITLEVLNYLIFLIKILGKHNQ